jgi:adenosylcobyric acid synthase
MGTPRYGGLSGNGCITVVVVRLAFISNFTDFDPFFHEPDVNVLFSARGADVENADLVIIPGTKNTVKDLLLLGERGLDASIRRAAEGGAVVMGMCGGYQMMGKKIYDPDGVESPHVEMDGLGLLDIETTFAAEKRTCRVEAGVLKDRGENGYPLEGYEIHMGHSTGDIGLFRVRSLSPSVKEAAPYLEGSAKGACRGTYLHGISIMTPSGATSSTGSGRGGDSPRLTRAARTGPSRKGLSPTWQVS